MLIHITPRFYAQPGHQFQIAECRLLSLQIHELGVDLKSSDLVTRKPFPNKSHWVGSRNIGRKALEGILFETPGHIPAFTTKARWAVNEEHIVVHEIEYRVLDQEFDTISDNTMLWSAGKMQSLQYPSRWPANMSWESSPGQPYMEIFPDPSGPRSQRQHVRDTVSADRLITLRQESLDMPTLERTRISSTDWTARMPPMNSVIRCSSR
ncbi:hypothetical protein P245_20360 [Comamonas thiooxydans]|uniref:Uncharacterized protein n=1 Tax=Comamonas thiooxydans TaxID=363952 RepID=A0A0E3BA99_9BURK|nr:DUF6012 family protein [Comamonas thiooxydans]KGG87418.1 hypothetical protein P245_20360 [Comamonas thiooxydans]